jgi:transcriptional regulator with XRE-family HTH domain
VDCSLEIGIRLRSERKRLGLGQEQFIDAVGISRQTQAAYEAGITAPTAVYLSTVAAKLEVDVLFVVTGIVAPRPVEGLSVKEDRVVNLYRSLRERDRQAVDRIVGVMWESSAEKRNSPTKKYVNSA